jgi:hypothetical protein
VLPSDWPASEELLPDADGIENPVLLLGELGKLLLVD